MLNEHLAACSGDTGNQRGRKGKAANHVRENLSGVAIRCGQDRPDEYGKTDGQEVKRGVITHAYRAQSGSTPDAGYPRWGVCISRRTGDTGATRIDISGAVAAVGEAAPPSLFIKE